MRRRLVALAAGLSLATTGCWHQAGSNATRAAYNGVEDRLTSVTVADLELAWSAPVGGEPVEPVADGRSVFVRTVDRGVIALDAGAGTERWRTSTDASLTGSGVPALVDGRLYVPSHCQLTILDPASGGVVTTLYAGPTRDPPPDGSESGCTNYDVLAANGRVLVPSSWGWRIGVGPGLPGCRLGGWYYAEGDWVDVIDVTGSGPIRTWAVDERTSGSCTSWPDLFPRPHVSVTLSGDQLVVRTGARVAGYPLAGCGAPTCWSPAWTVRVGAAADGRGQDVIALANGDVAVPVEAGGFAIVDGTTHTVEWTGTSGPAWLAATPTTLIAAAEDGTVAAYPVEGCGEAACAPLWSATLASPPSARPSIGADVVYVGSSDGTVTALDVDGCGTDVCTPLWSGSTADGTIVGAPAIFAGTVVVGSAGGTVTAFRVPKG